MTRRPTPEQPPDDGWLARAACRESDARLFTDPRPGTDDVRQALATCTTCSVRAACLTAALRHPAEADVGIWGGTTGQTRQQIRTGHLTVEEALHTRLPAPPEHQDVESPPARTTEMQASTPANGRCATDIPRLPEPELTVSRDRNGDYISADGRCVIFRIHGDPPWMLMIDSRCIARTGTLGEARRAAWQARHGTPDLAREHRFDAITRR